MVDVSGPFEVEVAGHPMQTRGPLIKKRKAYALLAALPIRNLAIPHGGISYKFLVPKWGIH